MTVGGRRYANCSGAKAANSPGRKEETNSPGDDSSHGGIITDDVNKQNPLSLLLRSMSDILCSYVKSPWRHRPLLSAWCATRSLPNELLRHAHLLIFFSFSLTQDLGLEFSSGDTLKKGRLPPLAQGPPQPADPQHVVRRRPGRQQDDVAQPSE